MSRRTRSSSEDEGPSKIRFNSKKITRSTMCYDIIKRKTKKQKIDFVVTTVKNYSTILHQSKFVIGNQNESIHRTIVMPIIELLPGYRCIMNHVIS